MSLRINSDFNGVTDPDAGAYIAAVEAADGNQLLEFGVGKAINDFVVGCKQDKIWDAIKASCILAGARTTNGALVPLKGTAPTPVNFDLISNTDYNRKTGLVGNGSSKYLDSNRNNNADPQNSSHSSVYASTAATSGAAAFPVYIGVGGASPGATHFGRLNSDGVLFSRCRNQTIDSANAGSGESTGLIGLARSASGSYGFRYGQATATVTKTSETPLAKNVFVFASADFVSGVAAATYANARLAFYSIGESLDLALLDARVTALITAFGVAIP